VPEPEIRDQAAVALEVRPLEILQKPAPTADHLQKASPTVMVVLVGIEMATEVIDPLGEQGDLNRGTPDVAFVKGVLLDDLCLVHALLSLLRSQALPGKQ
jgi:hypothetical protein